MTTPDIAGLCERLETHTVVEPQGDGADKLYHYPDGARAARIMRTQADTIERQAAEIERLRKGLSRLFNEKRPAYHDCIDAGEPQCVWCDAEETLTRAALTGEES